MQVTNITNSYSNYNNIVFGQILRNDIPAKVLKDNKYLLLVSGPSGVGKDTIMNELLDRFNKIVTHTTRPKREGEIDGINYFFTTIEKFVEGIKNNEFVEYVNSFSGKFYGTKRETIKKALNGQKPGLAIVDVDGAKNIKENLDANVISIFIKPPSMDVLKQRLLKRGTESEAQIAERLQKAAYEIEQAKNYDAVIQNENPEEGVRDIKALLNLE